LSWLSPPTREIQNEDDQSNYEQQMDESPADMKGEPSTPEEQKKNGKY